MSLTEDRAVTWEEEGGNHQRAVSGAEQVEVAVSYLNEKTILSGAELAQMKTAVSRAGVDPAVLVRGPWPSSGPAERFTLAVARVDATALVATIAAFPSYRGVDGAEAAFTAGEICCWFAIRGRRRLVGVPCRGETAPSLAGVVALVRSPVMTVSCSSLEPRFVFRRYRWPNLVLRLQALDAWRHRVWPTAVAWRVAVGLCSATDGQEHARAA